MVGRVARHEGGALSSRKISRDATGQVSFAVVAVTLLVASAVTGTILAKQKLDELEAGKESKLLDAMADSLDKVIRELGLVGASRAQAIVSGWRSFPVNESDISTAFSVEMSSYINSTFPRSDDRFNVVVSNWTGGLFYIELNTLDLVPSDATVRSGLAIEDTKMDFDKLPPPSAEVLAERTVNPYYVALGNFTVKVSQKHVSLAKQSSFQRPIISALPFLESKLRAFESSSEGEFSDLGKMVSYMLSTLCELRVLQGYGQPMYSGLNTSMILTEQDVHRAVSVGLLLEQARLFRSVDGSFQAQVAKLCGGGSLGIAALSSPRPRYLDPAELFLWFLGMTVPKIDSRTIISQAIYGMSDQLVVKMMDYMGWLGALDKAKDLADRIGESLDSFLAWLSGTDRSVESVTSWISKTVRSVGLEPYSIDPLFAAKEDHLVPVPERRYFVEDASGNLYPVWVGNVSAMIDIPTYSLLSSDEWGDFFPAFRDCQSDLRTLLQDGITRLAFDIADNSRLELDGVAIDPADGKGLFASLADGAGRVVLELDGQALSSAVKSMPMFSAQYELAGKFSEFVKSRGLELVDRQGLVEAAWSNLASVIVSSAKYSYIPNLAVPVEQQLADIVRSDVECDLSWGVGRNLASFIDFICHDRLEYIASLVNSSVTSSNGGFAGPLVDSVANMIVLGASGFPGLRGAMEQGLSGFAQAMLAQKEMSAYKDSVYLDLRSSFEFWEGERTTAPQRGTMLNESVNVTVIGGVQPMQVIPYDEEMGLGSLGHLFPTDNLLIQIKRPWDFDRGRSEYPNIHLTSLANVSATPFSTAWTVSVLGESELVLRSSDSAFQSIFSDGHADSQSRVRIDISFPIILHSAWPLQGVAYNPSNTILSDTIAVAKKFCDLVWKKLEPAFGWIKDGLERVYRFIGHTLETLASFAARVVKAISSALQTLVENLQSFVQKIANSVLGRAVQTFIDLTGRVEFRLSLFGFLVLVQTNLPDLLYRHGSDLLRLVVSTDRLGPGISFGIRVARLSDGSFDVLANGTISTKKMTVDVVVDPLMHIMRRLVEMHCVASKWAMDLVIPEVEPYELAEVSTADIPGIGGMLSNIPIPVLGLTASIEAGLRLKYVSPFPTDIVINEFEANPVGPDSGKEWVELFNPLDQPRCLDGWSLTTLHGKSSALELSGILPGGGLKVFTFPGTSIDNGEPGDPFNDGDSIALLDASGAAVDVTPMLRDVDNDARTNQRSWDGGPRWVFREGSMGNSNGVPVLLASSDFIAKSLFEAFKQAFEETQLQEVTASLSFIIQFAKRVLNNFIENLLSLVGEIIHELVFYLKVTINDASGSAGLGFRTSFVVTGGAVVELLRWLIHSIATFVVNLGRAANPIALPTFPQGFFSGLYVRFELLFEVGIPKMIRVLGAVGQAGQRLTCAVVISPNIPAFGKIVGKHWGNWSIDFGVCLSGVPKEFAAGILSKDTGKLIDFWIVKARLYGV